MIVAGPEGFMKTAYRKFNIRSQDISPGDDYGMLREVLTRRFSRALAQDKDDTSQWPDVVLIDGGKGQLSTVQATFADLGISDIQLIGIGKGPDRHAGRETFYLPDRAPFQLPPNHKVLYYLQRLRDEAHRFAIGAHRTRRIKAISTSKLDDVPGVGSARKRALLQHFGSAKAVEGAGLKDLEMVEGISKSLAKKIYEFFH
jgi:excinuclease ABC subunit C